MSKNTEKSQRGYFFVYSTSMRNSIMITTLSKEILETVIFLKNLQKREIFWQSRRSAGQDRSFPGKVGRNGTNLSTN